MQIILGRKPNIQKQKIVFELVNQGLSFREIATTLNMASRQLARYYYYQYLKKKNRKRK